jgi:hypothetical protein
MAQAMNRAGRHRQASDPSTSVSRLRATGGWLWTYDGPKGTLAYLYLAAIRPLKDPEAANSRVESEV